MRLEGWIQQRGVFHRKATDISIAQKMYTLIYQYARKSPNDRFCAQHGGKNKKKKAGVPFYTTALYTRFGRLEEGGFMLSLYKTPALP